VFPMSSEFGTYKPVKAILWPWLEPFSGLSIWYLFSCSPFARMRGFEDLSALDDCIAASDLSASLSLSHPHTHTHTRSRTHSHSNATLTLSLSLTHAISLSLGELTTDEFHDSKHPRPRVSTPNFKSIPWFV